MTFLSFSSQVETIELGRVFSALSVLALDGIMDEWYMLNEIGVLRLRVAHLMLVSLSFMILLLMVMVPQISFGIESDSDLAFMYAPVLRFTCGEKFYPTSVDYIISSSVLRQRNPNGTSILIDPAPNPDTLGAYTSSDLFLDNKLGTLEAIAADYASKADSIGYYAYVNIIRRGSGTVIQYWLFYVFNDGPLNSHQGDIEVIQVFLDASGNPKSVLASQHGAGQNAAWNDVERVGTHPIIYVAQGSHANYFRPYQGRIGIENDIVGDDGKTINPEQLNIVLLSDQSWLNFRGRWGYWGTDEEVALGRAGPLGPKYNQDGIRWSQPEVYLASTFHVDGNYFILAWLAANFMLLFSIYIAARSLWKIQGIIRLGRKGGLLVGKFLRGRGGIGIIVGAVAIIMYAAALFMPWYKISAQSEVGLLAQRENVTLMSIDGTNGITLNLPLGPESSDSSSGYVNLFSAKIPFAIILVSNAILLALDVIGVRSSRKLGVKFIIATIGMFLPIILIIAFVSQLSAFMPFAASLLPGRSIPIGIEEVVHNISVNPISGTANANLPVVGLTMVNWGFDSGAYLIVLSAILGVLAGLLIYTAPEVKKEGQMII
ncbi:MAG: hypothetical protein QXE26_05685 [Candidatus Bathyarchaeia archaeon]